ncbi:hypothetical protein CDL15_Pgr004548 [Punica granatum]|uniref:Uncharacterized protein n=1 Tax=Punica granatum TaxID=22663 RepID=A0A218WRD7_PUNGR|nr:hypothetical protein CDL15_Pgr004548 [Punica granatum]
MSRTVTHLDSMSTPHVALLPSSGTGHLMPFLRLAAALLAKEVHVMLITAHPMVSEAENEALSSFLSAFDKVNSERLDLLRIDPEQSMATDDPFYRHIDLKFLQSISSNFLMPIAIQKIRVKNKGTKLAFPIY